MEYALAASHLECGKVLTTVEQRIEEIPVAIKPDRVARIAGAALEDLLIDGTDSFATVAQPAADKIDHSFDLLWMLPRIGHTENAPTRLPADHDAIGVNKGHRQDRSDRGFDVAQRTIRPGNR